MNRRSFLAAIFGSAVASVLPAPAHGLTTGWASSLTLLRPGDIITMPVFYCPYLSKLSTFRITGVVESESAFTFELAD